MGKTLSKVTFVIAIALITGPAFAEFYNVKIPATGVEPSTPSATQAISIINPVKVTSPKMIYLRKDVQSIYCGSPKTYYPEDSIYIHRYCYDRNFAQSSNNPEPGYNDPPALKCKRGDKLFAFQALPDTSQTKNATTKRLGMKTGFGTITSPETGKPIAVSLVNALDGTSSSPVKFEVTRYAVCLRTSALGTE